MATPLRNHWYASVTGAGPHVPGFAVSVAPTLAVPVMVGTGAVSDPFRFTCIPGSGNTINCTGAALSGTVNLIAGPAFRTIIVKAFSSAIPGPYANVVAVDPDNTIPEGNEFDVN